MMALNRFIFTCKTLRPLCLVTPCFASTNVCHARFGDFQRCQLGSSSGGTSRFMSTESRTSMFSHVKQMPPPEARPDPAQGENDEDDKKARDESWRKMKWSLIAVFGALGITGSYVGWALGRPMVDPDGRPITDEFSHLPTFQQFFKRMVRELEYYTKMIKEPSRDKLLPDPLTYPYIQPPYTLVLELTDLLVHPEWTYQTGWRFKKRPGVDKFLEQVGPPLFEVVVYTAEQGMTVFPILDSLDPNGFIMYRLVRDATDFIDGHHVKNLDCLNRDLKKVIVVDWNENSVKLHPNNTFLLPRWKGNDDDTTLTDLATFLKTIATNDVDDVRDVLTYYRQFDDPIEAFRSAQKKLLEQMEERDRQAKQRKDNPLLASRWPQSNLFKR
ncbi:unnamed protein product [Nesidiocoris tenuis]|uniref:Mitochondrial import inner membrane translocase subunit TIM50 n=2 Tax=Nesidiocoris tenuis TaxID=355587 RepID=A0A6H5HAW5_9HEMI|nr:import inner membrane translocase subunit [Nesidiocoris tenuis]CAB0010503.1 unnamed protein product [Nesidiocoris tenuis]